MRIRSYPSIRLASAIIFAFCIGIEVGPKGIAEEKDLFSMDLEELSKVSLGKVGSRASHTSLQFPSTTTVLTQEDIRRFGKRTLIDLLMLLQDLYITTDRSYPSLGIRGFGAPDGFNTRVAISVDGHKLNEPIFQYAPVGEDLHIDVEHIEKIEIIKGPISSVWGGNALLGAVNIVTKKGTELQENTVKAEVGSGKRAKAFWESTGKSDSILWTGAISALHQEGESPLTFTSLNEDGSRSSTKAYDVDEEEAYRGHFSLNYGNFTFSGIAGRRMKVDPANLDETKFQERGNRAIDASGFLEARYDVQLDQGSNTWFSAISSYNRQKYYAYFVFPPNEEVSTEHKTRDEQNSRTVRGELTLSSKPFSWLEGVTGLEYQKILDVDRIYYTFFPELLLRTKTQDDYSVLSTYGELLITPLEQVVLAGGVRHDTFSTFESQWSPRLGLSYEFFPKTFFRINSSRAFRAPSLDELYVVKGEDPTTTIFNSGLKAETLSYYEVTLEKVFTKSTLNLSFFHYNLNGPITAEEIDGVYTGVKLPDNRSQGVELGYHGSIFTNSRVHLGASYSDAVEMPSTTRLLNAPTWLFKGALALPLWQENIYLAPEFSYVSSTNTPRGTTLGGQSLVHLTLSTEKLYKKYDLRLSFYNLFDQRVVTPAGDSFRWEQIPLERRNILFQVGYHF